MSEDTGLLKRLQRFGLNVITIDGWATRGRTYADFAPVGSVNHHTAGPLAGDAPSLGICINGRADLPGPLCHVLQSRHSSSGVLDDVYLIAAGVANHAGPGGWQGLAGNQRMHGLEVEHTGTVDEPVPSRRIETMARVHAA